MVYFNGNYIAADEIKAIVCVGTGRKDHPYRLCIYLSDRNFTVDYADKEKREADAEYIAQKVDDETSLGLIYTRLDQIERTFNRAEKRQLRIWRMLKKLLPLEPDEEENI